MDCKFNHTDERAEQRFSDPSFKGVVICGENLSISFHRKKELKMTQSWAIGMSVLELSKLVMQKLYYENVKPKLTECSVLMTDTDSWVLSAPFKSSDTVVKILKKDMDCSNYNQNHPLYDPSQKNKVGLLKNEVPNAQITKFAGVRSKTYAFKTNKNETESRAKGVKTCYKNRLVFETYADCVKGIKTVHVNQSTIQARNHQNMLIKANKVAFTSFEDKRYLTCAIHSVPYGSWLCNLKRCFFCKNPDLYC